MFDFIRRWREDRRIRAMGYSPEDWEAAVAGWSVMRHYQGRSRHALRDMALRFIARKDFASGADFPLTDQVCLRIATMACVPVLRLGLDWYDNWYTVIVYETDFVPDRAWVSEDGVVHEGRRVLAGEAWLRGPVILSWQSVLEAGTCDDNGHGHNVVIHELAHKLDMLHGGANGSPPMHPDMKQHQWHRVFSAAWERLNAAYDRGRALPLDDYALSSPAEFFAVCSEAFFETPANLKKHLPEVYALLVQFYRQDLLSGVD